MSEKVYGWLLRLYPTRFRARFGEEAMQDFRDRLGQERGAMKRARLWLDMLRDFTVSAPREYSRVSTGPARTVSGVPLFQVLEEERLRPDMFLLGTVLALVAVGTFGFLLTHGGNRVVFPAAVQGSLQSAMAPAAGASGKQEAVATGEKGEATPVPLVTPAERALVVRRVIDAVERYDPDRAEAAGVAGWLEEQEKAGVWDGIRSGPYFAGELTRSMHGATRSVTVTVLCGQEPAAGSSIWVRPSGRGGRAWVRIDEHFSVAVAPVKPAAASVLAQ